MGGDDEFSAGQIYKFQQIFQRFIRMVCRNTDQFIQECSYILDELNALDFTGKIAKEEEASALLRQCCYLVQLQHEHLVTRVCVLTVNLLSVQKMVLLNGADQLTEYLVEGLQRCSPQVTPHILHALGAVLYENSGRLAKAENCGDVFLQYHDVLLGRSGLLTQLITCVTDPKVLRGAVQCLDSFTIRAPNTTYMRDDLQSDCLELLLSVLRTSWPENIDDVTHSKILVNAIRGIQNIVLATKTVDRNHLGSILGTLKVYMFHGLPGVPVTMPTILQPVQATCFDGPRGKSNAGPSTPNPPKSEGATTQSDSNVAKSGGKGRKKRGNKSKGSSVDDASDQMDQLGMSSGPVRGAHSDTYTGSMWGNMSSSESEFSDSEGATGKMKAVHSKVRHSVLACFHAVIKATDKRTMFGYWASFIPNTPGIGPLPQTHTLFTVIIKDPSPKARTGALAVLTALLEGSKPYLMVAEESDQYRSAPFTPFSVTLGHMIKEIHRCLLLALVAENSPRAVTQIIKCLATLVPNVPYQRLKPGLLTKLVKQLKSFLSHRDPNIRVGCLTCLGALVSTQCPLLEVYHILQPRSHSQSSHSSLSSSPNPHPHPNPALTPGSINPTIPGDNANGSLATPPSGGSSGNLTPQSTPAEGVAACWLVGMCVGNVALHLVDDTGGATSGSDSLQPLPVRLESLQLLAQLSKGYFPLVRNSLILIRRLVQFCLGDPDTAIQLHGMKLLEVTTSSLLQQVEDTADYTQAQDFWLYVITTLLPLATQPSTYYAVRSSACDCLANIGPAIFEKLTMDKQVLCITWLLGMTHDDNHHVRAAAVRGLGICVLYPCLREDVSFVADTANTVIVAMEETSIVVRAKAAWSLGNLSDALVLNREGDDTEFVNDFSDLLLLKLFNLAIAGCHDNDKVKYNTVRALGSLLHYLPPRSVDNSRFKETVQLSIEALIKSITTGSMKVRWNACYAVGRMLHNEDLAVGEAPWTHALYTALTSVVKQCNNFKVKINAATALSVPRTRRCYGDAQEMALVWKSLIEALQAAESIVDFGDYKYRENLVDQVCSTFIHLATLLQRDDLDLVGASLSDDATSLQDYLYKHRQLLNSQTSDQAAEKVSAMKAAAAHVKTLGTADDLTDRELTTVRLLTKTLSPVMPFDVSTLRAIPSSPTNFRQTYD